MSHALTARLPRFLSRARRRLLMRRRGLAALAAAAAVIVGLQAAAPPSPDTTPVWTAARDLPGGHVLTRADLRRVDFAPSSAPDGLVSPDDVVGRALAAPLVRGAPLSTLSVVGDGLLQGHSGLAAVPVRITDPEVAGLLRVGDRIDLVASPAADPGAATTVVTDAVVLAIPQRRFEEVSAGLSGRVLVLGVTSGDVEEIVATQVTSFVTAVWTG